jgi:uncharacterized protein (TIGR02466 family)
MHKLSPDEYTPLNARLRQALKKLRQDDAKENTDSFVQTHTKLHTLPEFEDLNRFILGAAQNVSDFLKLAATNMEITGCWANINLQGVQHEAHTHPNNFLGGVYYLDAPAGTASIVFSDPRPQAHVISPIVEISTSENSGKAAITVEEGLLMLFPAWLTHAVENGPLEKERISIAFNLMFFDFTNNVSPTKWQGKLS